MYAHAFTLVLLTAQVSRRVHDTYSACKDSVARVCNINGIVMLVADAGTKEGGNVHQFKAVMQQPQEREVNMCNTLLHLRQIYIRHCNTSMAEVNA